MSSLHCAEDGRSYDCGYPPSFARSQNTGPGILGIFFIMNKIRFEKVTKKKKKQLLLFAASLVMGLAILTIIFFIIIGGSRLETQTQEKKAKAVEAEEQYTTTMRIVIMDYDGDIYRNEVDIYNQAGDYYDTYDRESFTDNQVITLESGEVNGIASAGIILGDEAGQQTNPYPNKIELWNTAEGIVVVNELDIEEYLKRVVPSEMPQEYGDEALKAQAVCARTYAYKHSNKYAYPEVQGQMDDTVSFQVYNQSNGTSVTNSAVEATAGKIIVNKSDDRPIDALYFSTSCGITQDGKIMGDDMDNQVLSGVFVGLKDEGVNDSDIYSGIDINEYIRGRDSKAYETDAKYYRWNTSIDKSGARNVIVSQLIELSEEPDNVACTTDFLDTLVSNNKSVGALQKISISERAVTGAATKMTFTFDAGEIVVLGQLNIRTVLGAASRNINLNDGSEISASILPSAIISMDDAGGNIMIYGGGYGHGCGMSQNGAKVLATQGMDYESILMYFYSNSKVWNY